MKRFLTLCIAVSIICSCVIPYNVNASTANTQTYYEEFIDNGYKYIVSVNGNKSTVVLINLSNNDERTFSYNDTTGIICEGDKAIGTVNKTSTRSIIGPYNVAYDIGVDDVAAIISAILAVAAIITALHTSGLSAAAFKKGLQTLIDAFGSASIAIYLGKDWNVNGVYSYKCEVNGTRCRYIDRKVSMRFGTKTAYKYYDLGNGGWFDSLKPYAIYGQI